MSYLADLSLAADDHDLQAPYRPSSALPIPEATTPLRCRPAAPASAEAASLASFAASGTDRLVATESPLDADTVLHKAMFLVGERKYSRLMNNCEHFASWCTSGDAYSSQVLWPMTWIGRAAAVLAAPVLIPINVGLVLGGEPWDAPQWCRHCEQEHDGMPPADLSLCNQP